MQNSSPPIKNQKSKIKKITYTFMNIAHDNAHITKQKINSISTR